MVKRDGGFRIMLIKSLHDHIDPFFFKHVFRQIVLILEDVAVEFDEGVIQEDDIFKRLLQLLQS